MRAYAITTGHVLIPVIAKDRRGAKEFVKPEIEPTVIAALFDLLWGTLKALRR